jgi:3-oxoacyl-[acyl-carrier-protein] synthase-3
MVHKWLGLSDQCAAFDVGLGCSGYPYGLYLAAAMLKAGGQQRILMLHGETPSRFTSPDDHATTLLFGDAGSATALELCEGVSSPAHFSLQTDGSGYAGLIMRGGAFRDREPADPRERFLQMDGAGIFNFTIRRVPPLVRETLDFAGLKVDDIDWFLFHQSNRFIMKHLAKKCGLPEQRVPMVLENYGNCGGPSVAMALTQGLPLTERKECRVMMLGYGVGLSWSAAIAPLDADSALLHSDYSGTIGRA